MKYNIINIENNTSKIIIQTKYFDIKIIKESGQCFNFKIINGKYVITSIDKSCVVIRNDNKNIIYCLTSEVNYWVSYFNLDISFEKYLDTMKNHKNNFIKIAANYSVGLILLKQDLWETIVSFIISQRKSIPSIFTSIERLKESFGENKTIYLEEIGEISFKTFPTASNFNWSTNIEVSVKELKNNTSDRSKKLKLCGLGYRDEYILYAANWYNSLTSEAIESLYNNSSEAHMSELLKIKGVGTKVANCICLFAFNDLDSFPIDVWIQRILDKKLLPEDLSEFNGYKGFLQQVIFFYIINNKNIIK